MGNRGIALLAKFLAEEVPRLGNVTAILTAYQLAEPDAQQVALCVFVRTKEPRIDWYVSARQPAHLAEYLAKAGLVGCAIAAGHFYKRPGKWCGYCDYLPVCLGDQEKVDETLAQVAPR